MKRTVWKTMFESIFTFIFIWMFIGCALPPKPFTPKSHPAIETEAGHKPATKQKNPAFKKPISLEKRHEFYVHKVRWTGETLSVIAQWYTGNQSNWEHIVKANSDLDLKRIRIDDKILIPVAMLKTRKPMPRKYLKKTVRKKHALFSPIEKPATKPDKEKVVATTKKDLGAAQFNKVELFQPKTIERSARKLDEIELFQPENIKQTVAEPVDIELFQPVE